MNEQRIDELFKEKLANYSEMPSLEAREKLSAKQDERKRNIRLQFAKLAAVIALIAVSVNAVRNWNDNTQDDKVTQVTAKKPVTTGNSKNEIPQNVTPSSLKSNKKISEISSPEDQVVSNHHPDKVATAETSDITNMENTGGLSVFQQDTDSVLDLTVPLQTRPKVTITYKKSPDPPKPMLALQSQGETKSSVLMKLRAKAQSINFSEVSLASIRGTKDELLAIDRKSKTKESKSK